MSNLIAFIRLALAVPEENQKKAGKKRGF